jgi:hypothetical protein
MGWRYEKLAVFQGHGFHMCPAPLEMDNTKLEITISENYKAFINTLKVYILICNICIEHV